MQGRYSCSVSTCICIIIIRYAFARGVPRTKPRSETTQQKSLHDCVKATVDQEQSKRERGKRRYATEILALKPWGTSLLATRSSQVMKTRRGRRRYVTEILAQPSVIVLQLQWTSSRLSHDCAREQKGKQRDTAPE